MNDTRSVPGPPRYQAIGNVRAFLNNRPEFLADIWRRYGDYARFQLGVFDVYLINDPELIRHVLMNYPEFDKTPAIRFLSHILGNGIFLSGGEFYRRQRRLMQPAFQPKRIATYADIMLQIAAQTAARWREADEIDIHTEMMRHTLNVAAQTLFQTDIDRVCERITESINVLLPFVDRIAKPTGALQMWLPTEANRRFRKARARLDELIYDMIRDHRESGEDRGDLLSMLIMAQDDDSGGTRMTDEQVRDEVITVLFAGHETTAVALSWLWHMLYDHPAVEARLHAELDTVLEGRAPTADDVPRLTYTRQVVSETLRLYPPAPMMDRITTRPWDTGRFIVPKGKYIFLSPYTMQRHPEYWPQPERFDPGRWTPEAVGSRPKFAYFPFGGGPRVCIGEQFAWTEMILTIAALAQQFRLERVRLEPPRTEPIVSLRPESGVKMRVLPRKVSVAEPIA